jgi:hypothetical protein
VRVVFADKALMGKGMRGCWLMNMHLRDGMYMEMKIGFYDCHDEEEKYE